MNANITSKHHFLLISLIALNAFSYCSAMQDGDRNAADQPAVYMAIGLVSMSIIFVLLSDHARCETRDGVSICYDADGRCYTEAYVPVAQKSTTNGCTCMARRWIREYDDGTRLSNYVDRWTCVCDSDEEKEEVKRFGQERKKWNDRARCPKRERRPKNLNNRGNKK